MIDIKNGTAEDTEMNNYLNVKNNIYIELVTNYRN